MWQKALMGAVIWVAFIGSLSACTSSGPGSRLEVRSPAPQFTLVNQDLETVSLADLRGKAVLQQFIYTRCTTVCPMMTSDLARMQEGLEGGFAEDVVLVSISFDPEHDSPAVLKEYAARFGADLSGWHFLTGSADQIAGVLSDYGVEVTPVSPSGEPLEDMPEEHGDHVNQGLFEHTVVTVLIDANGHERQRYFGTPLDSDRVLADIDALLKERERGPP
jgi:protein SCO1/2